MSIGGWITAILNLLNMGGGQATTTTVHTATGTWEVPARTGTWEVPARTGTWEVPE